MNVCKYVKEIFLNVGLWALFSFFLLKKTNNFF